MAAHLPFKATCTLNPFAATHGLQDREKPDPVPCIPLRRTCPGLHPPRGQQQQNDGLLRGTLDAANISLELIWIEPASSVFVEHNLIWSAQKWVE